MEEEVKYTINDLQKQTYRYLQQLAKSMNLPSNVKKVYLIQLIHAKQYRTELEVNTIIQQVKLERQQLAQSKKRNRRRLQGREISSTSKLCTSPPITLTPKRPGHIVLRCSPDMQQALMHRNSHSLLSKTSGVMPRVSSSDRVLRSFNLKALRKPVYSTMSTDNSIGYYKATQTSPRETRINIVSHQARFPKVNVTAKCLVRRHRPSILSGSSCLAVRNESHKLLLHNEEISAPLPKRQRTLSGIYPLMPHVPQNFETIQGVRLRRTDGRLSTINALVQKRHYTDFKPPPKPNYRNEISIQDIINSIDANLNEYPDVTNNNYLPTPYPNLSGIPDMRSTYNSYNTSHINQPVITIDNSYKEADVTEDMYSVYYHKKIRSEQVKYQRMNYREPEGERLPKINDAFSRFSAIPSRDVTQPLYVHVGDEAERAPPYQYPRTSSAHMLENLYNFKNSLITNTPLLQIATTANTRCVYSTPVIATAMAQQTPTLVADPFSLAPLEPDSTYQYRCCRSDAPRYDLARPQLDHEPLHRDYGHSEDFSTSTSSLETSQSQIGVSVTIPEMVEDALELISQDGDYMEQIGMDIRVQCVLCSWAGPKIILEFHIRKEHPSQIQRVCDTEWSVTYTLGSLVKCQLWLNHVVEHDSLLYVLSAKYEDPDCFMATLSCLSSEPMLINKRGTITIYNKLTGEPYSWEGDIPPLPPNMPYENDLICLKIDLSKLDLIPNSANIKLLNRELVVNSPSKVVVGQPELNDIHIILFIRIS